MLGVHPQAVFETCAHLAGHGNTPARQRPDLAVVLTAGLAAEHDMRGEYGIDIEDLNPGHSLRTEPASAGFATRLSWSAMTCGSPLRVPAISRGPRAIPPQRSTRSSSGPALSCIPWSSPGCARCWPSMPQTAKLTTDRAAGQLADSPPRCRLDTGTKMPASTAARIPAAPPRPERSAPGLPAGRTPRTSENDSFPEVNSPRGFREHGHRQITAPPASFRVHGTVRDRAPGRPADGAAGRARQRPRAVRCRARRRAPG